MAPGVSPGQTSFVRGLYWGYVGFLFIKETMFLKVDYILCHEEEGVYGLVRVLVFSWMSRVSSRVVGVQGSFVTIFPVNMEAENALDRLLPWLFMYLSIYPSVYLSASQPASHPSMHVSVRSFVCLSVCVSIG